MMRTIKIAFGLFLLFCVPAWGTVKCVALNSSTNCTFVQALSSQSDWGSVCSNINISGVSMCGYMANNWNASVGWATESVQLSSDLYKNDKCFCKMMSPAVSRWVYAKDFSGDGGAGNCATWCQSACAGILAENSALRSGMFGVLYE